jgi:cell division protein ZapA
MVNKVRLTIAGTTYVVSTTDSEEYVTQLAQQLDAGMKEAMKASPSLSITRAAVFCALDYLDQYKKSTGSADNMRSQIKDYLADAAKAKLEAEDARREIERLKREVQYLKEQNGSAPSGRA